MLAAMKDRRFCPANRLIKRHPYAIPALFPARSAVRFEIQFAGKPDFDCRPADI